MKCRQNEEKKKWWKSEEMKTSACYEMLTNGPYEKKSKGEMKITILTMSNWIMKQLKYFKQKLLWERKEQSYLEETAISDVP